MKEIISLENGKYTFEFDPQTAQLICLRYGEPWREFIGDKAIGALFSYALDMQRELQAIAEDDAGASI